MTLRLLHTSDWHLGRSFHREDLLGAQAAYIDHLVETVRSERIGCVVVSGDIYDRALPSVDAVALCDDALRRLVAERVTVVMISGNHDSAQRLGFGSDLMEAAGVHIRTDPANVGEPVLPVEGVAVYGIPYLEPDLVCGPWELTERGHTAVLTEGMRRIRADLADRLGSRSVVLAHAFVTGGEASDSERDISVGGAANVPAGVFDGIDYAALGHLHGRQRMTETARYSGSPIAYSFSEDRQRKGAWLVTLGDDRVDDITFAEAPVPRPVSRVRGRLDDLLSEDRWARYESHWLQVTLTDQLRPPGAMERVRARFPHALALVFEPEGVTSDERTWQERVRERTDLDVAFDFVGEVRGEPADAVERELLSEAFECCRREEVS